MPSWLRYAFAVVGLAIVGSLVYTAFRRGSGEASVSGPAVGTEPVSSIHAPFPDPLATLWPGILIRIDSVARLDDATMLAEWAYVNEAPAGTAPFEWGHAQPNFAALTRLLDGAGQSYAVAMTAQGTPLCADTNRADEPERSKALYGDRALPAWAQFRVPLEAPAPFRIVFHGVAESDPPGVPVRILTATEQAARAFVPKPTTWPNVFIQLTSARRTAEGRLRIAWQYLNRNPDGPFSWGADQPNFAAATQVYDFRSGRYHAVSERPGAVSSTNQPDRPDWSREIPAGAALDAHAEFDDVPGDRIQILFHRDIPMFVDPSRQAGAGTN